MTALSLKEAAKFLDIHKETLRRLAVAGVVRGSKLARWKFLKDDLEAAVRSGYPYSALRGKEDECSAKSKAVESGMYDSPTQRDAAYFKLLERKTKDSPGNLKGKSLKKTGEKRSTGQ
jgi:hypothetical protein